MVHGQIGARACQLTWQIRSNRWFFFCFWIAASSLLFMRPLGAVIQFAAQNDDASHIFLIPFISAGLIWLERRTVFPRVSNDFVGAALLGVAGAALGAVARFGGSLTVSQSSAAYMLALVLLWVAGFALMFGREAMRAARFSLLFLLLAVPLPDFLLTRAVYFLQRGSAELVAGIFDLTGVPYLRERFVFHLSSVSIEIAEECSGIRSSMAVLILALLATHFYLRTFWKQAVFIVSSLLIMIVKNGVRIATLTILSMYVDPSFLFGRLHRDGGVVLLLLGLTLLIPVLWLLKRSEAAEGKDLGIPPKSAQDA
jgi:exosortase